MKRAPTPAAKLSLTDLAKLREQLKHDTEAREAERQRAEAAARQAAEEANVFRASIGEVSALRQNKRVEHPRNPPAPDPVHSRAEEQTVLRDSLSDEFDIDNLLETDDTLSYRRPGIGEDVLKKLRRGEWATQDEIDLHGLRRDEAREALAAFLRRAVQRGIRCVRVVHGKGLGSPDKTPVLKGKVTRPRGGGLLVVRGWQPRPADAGALLRSRATSANCCSRLHPRATRPRCSASTCGATRAPPVAPVACARLAGQARQRTLSRARSTLASDVKNYELIPQHLKLKLTLSSGRGLESPGVLPTSFKNRFVFAFRWKTVKKARSASIAVAALQAGV